MNFNSVFYDPDNECLDRSKSYLEQESYIPWSGQRFVSLWTKEALMCWIGVKIP